ncbi:unnamed protein product [Camellia sinensis]
MPKATATKRLLIWKLDINNPIISLFKYLKRRNTSNLHGMDTLNTELKQTSLATEFEHESTPISGLRIHFDSEVNGVDLSTSEKNLRSSSSKSSSSSPDSPFDNPFKDDDHETNKYNTDTIPSKPVDDPHLASNYGETNVLGSSIPKDEKCNVESLIAISPPTVASDSHQLNLHNTSTTESPPIQAMDSSGNPTCRIPDRVFSRTKSVAPVEWSVASNESLFSIQMGNMSFSKDNMFWRSEEFPGEHTTSSQFVNLSPNHTPINKRIDSSKSSKSNVAEAVVETMNEVTRESAEDKINEQLPLAPCISNRSDISGTSVKSFAFPILTGDGNGDSTKISSSPRVGPEPLQQEVQTQTLPEPKSESQPKPKDLSQPSTPWTKWLSCFTCCSFCS